MLRQNRRLHRAAVHHVLKDGAFKKTPFFALRQRLNEENQHRYAIVLSTKLEKSAVKRNQKRRQIYSAIAELEKNGAVPSQPSYDRVVLVRSTSLELDYQALKEALGTLLHG